jgi:hypothetical protein
MAAIVNFCRSWSDPLSWRLSGSIFYFTKDVIQQYYARAISQGPEIEGCPSLLTANEIEWMQAKIYERFCIHESMIYDELLDEIEIETEKLILPDTLRKIIARLPWCRTVQGIPKETRRVRCDEADVAAYSEDLKRLITRAPVNVTYNVDEAGFHEWVDATRHRVIVPAEFKGNKSDVSISRANSWVSMMACIAADGQLLTPMVIVPRKTVEIELYQCDFMPDAYSFVWQENDFCTRLFFDRWCFELFFPDTVEQYCRFRYTGFIFLILDGCSGHASDAIEDGFSYFGMFPIAILPRAPTRSSPLTWACLLFIGWRVEEPDRRGS